MLTLINLVQFLAAISQCFWVGTGGISALRDLFISSSIASSPWCWFDHPEQDTTEFSSISKSVTHIGKRQFDQFFYDNLMAE